jgi:hypothetical protein
VRSVELIGRRRMEIEAVHARGRLAVAAEQQIEVGQAVETMRHGRRASRTPVVPQRPRRVERVRSHHRRPQGAFGPRPAGEGAPTPGRPQPRLRPNAACRSCIGASRPAFKQSFDLANHVEVVAANLDNGLLTMQDRDRLERRAEVRWPEQPSPGQGSVSLKVSPPAGFVARGKGNLVNEEAAAGAQSRPGAQGLLCRVPSTQPEKQGKKAHEKTLICCLRTRSKVSARSTSLVQSVRLYE